MISGKARWFAWAVVLAVSAIGVISVCKAVYLDKRDLNCACVGSGSKVPLGSASLGENLMMMGRAIWMTMKPEGFA
jgi:hypothetical protein